MVEPFLDELETDGVGRGNQVNMFRVLKAILRDAYGKGAEARAVNINNVVADDAYRVHEQIHSNTHNFRHLVSA